LIKKENRYKPVSKKERGNNATLFFMVIDSFKICIIKKHTTKDIGGLFVNTCPCDQNLLLLGKMKLSLWEC